MRYLVEGSLEQSLLKARVALCEWSKQSNKALTLISTFEDHMYVAEEDGNILRLSFDGSKVTLSESVATVQSVRRPIVEMIAREIESINSQLSLLSQAKDSTNFSNSLNQSENIATLLNRYVILEEKTKDEKGKSLSKQDKAFYKKAMDFLDDLGIYIKRLLKESSSVPVSRRLTENTAQALCKLENILGEI